MAGQELIKTVTPCDDGRTGGLPLVIIVENGMDEPGDEWSLFRLTDDGWEYYKIGMEFAAGIMELSINNEPAVQEISRHKTKDEAVETRSKLSEEEQGRTLIRSVRPK